MRNVMLILGFAVLVLGASVVWQVASCELANVQLQDDMRDLASQAGSRVGLVAPKSDKDFRGAVARKAKEHSIELNPNQVTVKRSGFEDKQTVSLAADYTAPIRMPGFSFTLHFTPSSVRN